jgi:hypothetical protein
MLDAVQSLCASIAGPSSTLQMMPCWLLDFCALLCCAGRGGWTACLSVVLQSELVLHLGEIKWVSRALPCFRGEDLVSSSVGQDEVVHDDDCAVVPNCLIMAYADAHHTVCVANGVGIRVASALFTCHLA